MGGDKPHNTSNVKTKYYPFPLVSNGLGLNAIVGYTNSYKIKGNCVTMSSRGTIGYPEVRDYPFYPIYRTICLIPRTLANVNFIKNSLTKYNFSKQGGVIKQLTTNDIDDIQIFMPSFAEQQKIGELFNKFDKLIGKINNKIKKLRDIKESFMNREFSKLNN
nr:restriction endonuclease subunit S [Mycoplasma sp. E35C]